MKSRRKFTADFKARVTLEAIKGQQTLAELSARYELTQSQIANWKKEFLSKASLVFTQEAPEKAKDKDKEIQGLYAKIGQLEMERDFLKKVDMIYDHQKRMIPEVAVERAKGAF